MFCECLSKIFILFELRPNLFATWQNLLRLWNEGASLRVFPRLAFVCLFLLLLRKFWLKVTLSLEGFPDFPTVSLWHLWRTFARVKRRGNQQRLCSTLNKWFGVNSSNLFAMRWFGANERETTSGNSQTREFTSFRHCPVWLSLVAARSESLAR